MTNLKPGSKTVVGVFPDVITAHSAISDLKSTGIDESDIRLCDANGQDAGRLKKQGAEQKDSQAGGGFFSFFFGNDYGSDERLGPHRERLREHESYFANIAHGDEKLVLVETDALADQATEILRRNGGRIETEAASRFAESKDTFERIVLRDEKLIAHKEDVETGEVRLRKEVITETKTIEVPVEREVVVVERRDLSTGETGVADQMHASASELEAGEVVRIPVSEQRVNVEKRSVPREEIVVGKRTVKETKQMSDEVKREEARIESKGRVNLEDRRNRNERKEHMSPPTP